MSLLDFVVQTLGDQGETLQGDDSVRLKTVMVQKRPASSSSLGSEIVISVTQMKRHVKLAENLPLKVTIKNIGSGVVAKGSTVEFSSGGHYEKKRVLLRELESGQSTTISVALEPSSKASLETLPEKIFVTVYKPNSDIPHQSDDGGFQVEMANLAGDLVDWNSGVPGYENTKANIMVFGHCGSGVSALINSILSLTHRTYQNHALSLQSDKRVTTGTGYFGELAGFGFLDTQGAEANYLNSEFSLLLKGALPIGYDVVQGHIDISEVVKQHEETATERRIHSCIYVTNQAFRYLDREDLSVQKMKQFIDDGKKFNLHPILAVTKMDEVQEEEVPKVKKEISSLIGINQNDIFLISNPPSEKGSKAELKTEKAIYQLLWRALEAAKTFMKQEKVRADNTAKAEEARHARGVAKRKKEEEEEQAKRERELEEKKARLILEMEQKKKQLKEEDELEELAEKLRLEEEAQRVFKEEKKRAREKLNKEKAEQLRVEIEAEKQREEARIRLQEIENQRLKDELEAEKRRLQREVDEKEAARKKQLEEERIREETRIREAIRAQEKAAQPSVTKILILVAFLILLAALFLK